MLQEQFTSVTRGIEYNYKVFKNATDIELVAYLDNEYHSQLTWDLEHENDCWEIVEYVKARGL